MACAASAWCVVVLLLAVRTQTASAVCDPLQPPVVCEKDLLTGAPTDLDCWCPRPLSVSYNSEDPFMTQQDCPSCPNIPGFCPDIVPSSPHKAIICHKDGNGYRMLEVAQAAVHGHLRHGDFVPTVDTCCICDLDLCAARQHTIDVRWQAHKMWFDPANLVDKATSFAAYRALLEPTLTPDYAFISQGVGRFSPRLIAMEYDIITTPYIGDQINFLDQQPYNVSWSNNGTVLHWYTCERYALNVPPAFQAAVSMYRGEITFRFVPNSPLMYELYDISACPFRGPSPPPDSTQIFGICAALAAVCSGVPSYQFNDGDPAFTACRAHWEHLAAKQNAILSGQCRYTFPGTADTIQCRQTHFLSALVDANVHCPHTNVVSAPCKDTLDDYPGDSCGAFYTGPPHA